MIDVVHEHIEKSAFFCNGGFHNTDVVCNSVSKSCNTCLTFVDLWSFFLLLLNQPLGDDTD